MNKIKLLVLLNLPLLLPAGAAFAQQPDTLGGIRTFVKVCNSYKQLPLQLDVKLQNTTNFITGREDTISTHAMFYLQPEGSYISFGELEQVVNDSVMLLVSKELKRMMVYSTRNPVTNQLQQYLGFQFHDSSLLRIAAKYTAVLTPPVSGEAGIEVNSRALVYNTHLPKETIHITYSMASGEPTGIVQLKRSLFQLDSALWETFREKPEWAGKLITGPGNSFFLVKEQGSTFIYGSITHTAGIKLPVLVSDRINEAAPGKYAPAKEYGDYLLTQNF